jgi:hypothetical protein
VLTVLPYYKETFVLKVVEEDVPTGEAPPETPPRVATVGYVPMPPSLAVSYRGVAEARMEKPSPEREKVVI